MTQFADEESTAALLGGRYVLHECIGQGAMAQVFRADDVILGRPVAIKMMRESPEGTAPTPRARTEMALLASLNHPSLVTLFDAMVEPGQPEYLVMELVEGTSLADALRDGPMTSADAAVLATELAGALHIVHAAGIVHRDIKPSNVLMATDPIPGRRPRAKLADFGVALLADGERLTSPGLVVGTAAYLAPEQVRGAAPAPPADIYALGLVLREALTGERAYPDATGIGAVMARLVESPSLPSWIGPEWTALLTAMLAPEPADRPRALDVVSAAATLPTHIAPPPPLPPLPPLPADLGGPLAGAPVPTVALPVAAATGPGSDDALSIFDGLREPAAVAAPSHASAMSGESAVPAAVAASAVTAHASATGVFTEPITRRQHRVPRRARSRTRMLVMLGAALAAVAILGVNAATWVGSLNGPGTATLRELPTNVPTDEAVVETTDDVDEGVVATTDDADEPVTTLIDAPADKSGDRPATSKKPAGKDTDKAAKKAQRDAEKAAKKAERDAEKAAREDGKKQRDEQRRSAPGKDKGAGKDKGKDPGGDKDSRKGKNPRSGADDDAVQLAVTG